MKISFKPIIEFLNLKITKFSLIVTPIIVYGPYTPDYSNNNRNGFTAYRKCSDGSNSRIKCVCKIKRGKRIFKCGNLNKFLQNDVPKGCKQTT